MSNTATVTLKRLCIALIIMSAIVLICCGIVAITFAAVPVIMSDPEASAALIQEIQADQSIMDALAESGMSESQALEYFSEMAGYLGSACYICIGSAIITLVSSILGLIRSKRPESLGVVSILMAVSVGVCCFSGRFLAVVVCVVAAIKAHAAKKWALAHQDEESDPAHPFTYQQPPCNQGQASQQPAQPASALPDAPQANQPAADSPAQVPYGDNPAPAPRKALNRGGKAPYGMPSYGYQPPESPKMRQ